MRIRRGKAFQKHRIKENKRNNLPRHIIAVDTEAYLNKFADYEIHTLRLGWVIYEDLKRGTHKELEFKKVEEFYDFLKSLRVNKRRFYVFAHNFDYDAQILDLLNISKYLKGEIKKAIVDGRNFIIRFKHIWKEEGKEKSATYIFISTTNYFKRPLKKIGKMLGLEKLEVDFENVDDKELSVYCYRDTKIVLELVKYYIEFLRNHDFGNFQFTIASQAFTAYRHRFMNYDIIIHDNDEALTLELRSYKGGRTEAFQIGDCSKFGKIYKLDINSMYPFVMREYEYPIKLITVINNPSVKTLLHYNKRYLVIAEVDYYIEKPAVGVKRDRLIFPVGKIHDTVTTPEINLILKYGYIKKVYKMAIYEKAPIFRDWVEELYNLRRYYKDVGNDIMQFFVKILMNSLYGKFGQKVEEYKLIGECSDCENEIIRYWDGDNQKWVYRMILDGKIYEKGDIIVSDNSFPAIASFVTAYARCYLWELIEKAGIDNVLYMDTDSLFTTEKGYRNLKNYIDNKELGKLKLEEVGEKVIINNVKDYIFNDEIKLKGIKKDAVKIDENKYIQKQFVKVRSNLYKYHENGVVLIYQQKELKREYKKGIVLSDGRVIPFKLEEW